MIDFKNISENELDELNKERSESIEKDTNGWVIERNSYNPIINELKFNYGFFFIEEFLISNEGVKLELHFRDREMRLAYIGVLEEERRQGKGNKTMEILISLADKYDYDIDLQLDTQFGIKKNVLEKFYKNFGFIKNNYDDIYIRESK